LVSIHKAFKTVLIKENQQKAKAKGCPPLPEGIYDVVVYADLPWRYDYGDSVRGKADMYYATISTEEIIELPI
jgi:hypothetical protein